MLMKKKERHVIFLNFFSLKGIKNLTTVAKQFGTNDKVKAIQAAPVMELNVVSQLVKLYP